MQKDWRRSSIFYFTAKAYWRPDKVSRHDKYIEVLNDKGITVVEGRFKPKEKSQWCLRCGQVTKHKSHEEKQTDVTIA